MACDGSIDWTISVHVRTSRQSHQLEIFLKLLSRNRSSTIASHISHFLSPLSLNSMLSFVEAPTSKNHAHSTGRNTSLSFHYLSSHLIRVTCVCMNLCAFVLWSSLFASRHSASLSDSSGTNSWHPQLLKLPKAGLKVMFHVLLSWLLWHRLPCTWCSCLQEKIGAFWYLLTNCQQCLSTLAYLWKGSMVLI